MDQIITVINDLHDAFATVQIKAEINLPQIAVVGSQSSGKSSVLEAIVGKDFLPRGSGIVTRCPLVLQLVQLPNTNDDVEWGEFLHKPGQKYTDFNEIHNEILSRTEEVAGKTSITHKPINLKVYSRHVLNLTLVDLPGLVVNAVGDQPKDIDRQIKNMVTEYVSQENTIILAVSPANADIATSASLQLAGKIDPEGVRTVGVMTKLDLMDKGTDAMNVLNGGLVPLRHGFVGVVNRSQQDINDGKGMQASRDDEMTFLNNHKVYSAIAKQHGTGFLTKKLNQLLLKHAKTVIPDVKKTIDKLIMQTYAKMKEIDMFNCDGEDSIDQLHCLMKSFSDDIRDKINGGLSEKADELVGGARLNYAFHEWFAKQLNTLKAEDELTDEYIRIESRNLDGMNPTLLPLDKAFNAFSKKQIARLKDLSQSCVIYIYDELMKIVDICALKLDPLPKLRQFVSTVCRDMLQDYLKSAQLHVETVIRAESTFIDVKHPRMKKVNRIFYNEFNAGTCEGNKRDSEEKNDEKESEVASEEGQQEYFENYNEGGEQTTANQNGTLGQEGKDINQSTRSNNAKKAIPFKITLKGEMAPQEKSTSGHIRDMVEKYFAIVKETVADQVPKAVVVLMVENLKEKVHSKLIKNFYKEKGDAKVLLTERPEVAEERDHLKKRITALTKAKSVLDTVEDYILTDKNC